MIELRRATEADAPACAALVKIWRRLPVPPELVTEMRMEWER